MRWLLILTLLAAGPVRAESNSVTVDDKTESVIRGALKYLAAQQEKSGAWNAEHRRIAMTGYVLMAFLATGNLPNEGPYGKNVAAGVQYLLDQVRDDGMFEPHQDGQYMYGHGIATIALAEVYGQTRSPSLREKLEKLVNLIINSQNSEGGWRYRPTSRDSDMSFTVLQLVALRAAKNGGLEVPQSVLDQAVEFVQSCYREKDGGFAYQPRQGPGFARTAAAIYSLQVAGKYDDPHVKAGSEYLFEKADDREWFTYGHFYAGPAQYMIGGETWTTWYARMRELLLKEVKREGELAYWESTLDKQNKGLCPLYCTAVYTTILAIPYHYIPLYQR